MTHETFTPAQGEGRQHPPIVYLVDDDPSFLRALSRRLRAADYRVKTFASADEFLKRDRSETSGCAVLDLQMRSWRAGVAEVARPRRRTTAGDLFDGPR